MGSPHYTPSGVPRKDVFSSSQRFRDELLAVETGVHAMRLVPFSIYVPDLNVVGGTEIRYHFVYPFDCNIVSLGLTNAVTQGAFSSSISILGNGGLNVKLDKFQDFISILSLAPKGTIDFAEALLGPVDDPDGTNGFSAGEFGRLRVSSSMSEVVVMPGTVTITLERT